MLPLLESCKSIIKKHGNTIKVNTLVKQVAYTLFTLRETLETKPILLHFIIENDTLPRIADFTARPTQIVQILTAKTLKIVFGEVNTHN